MVDTRTRTTTRPRLGAKLLVAEVIPPEASFTSNPPKPPPVEEHEGSKDEDGGGKFFHDGFSFLRTFGSSGVVPDHRRS